MPRYPLPEGRAHNLIRDRARYLRFVNYTPREAWQLALEEWREGGPTVVKPKTGAIYRTIIPHRPS